MSKNNSNKQQQQKKRQNKTDKKILVIGLCHLFYPISVCVCFIMKTIFTYSKFSRKTEIFIKAVDFDWLEDLLWLHTEEKVKFENVHVYMCVCVCVHTKTHRKTDVITHKRFVMVIFLRHKANSECQVLVLL